MVVGGCWLSVVGGCVGSLCFFSSSSYFRLIHWFSIILGCLKRFRLVFVVSSCSKFFLELSRLLLVVSSCFGCFVCGFISFRLFPIV